LWNKLSQRMPYICINDLFRFVQYCDIMGVRVETHDGKKRRPSIRDFFTNLSGPMSLRSKISLLIRNNAIKIKNQQDCCGHPGEPGC